MNLRNTLSRKLHSFRSKLLLAFLVAVFIPLIAITGISWYVSRGIATDNILTSVLMNDEQLTAQINNRISQTESIADTVNYRMYNLESASSDVMNAINTFVSLRNDLSLYKNIFNLYHIFVFLNESQDAISMGINEGLYFFPLDKLKECGIDTAQLTAAGTNSCWISSDGLSLPYVLNGKNTDSTILCFRTLTNQSTHILEYAYCIALKPSDFSDMLSASISAEEISSYILSPDGRIIASGNPEENGTMLSQENIELFLAGSNTLYHQNHTYYNNVTLSNGWIHITEIPDEYLQRNTHILVRSILVAFFLCISLSIFIIVFFSENLSRRLKKLSSAMESFHLEHNSAPSGAISLSYPEKEEHYDEIDKLGISFEEMQHTIGDNVASIVDFSVREERLKYQLLQSQINPHFLYNILGSIKTCQSLGKIEEANQMITDLTAFYRLTLRKTSDLIPIQDELQIAKLYLDMEKICHNNSLNWEIHVEDGVENFLMCRFTLQPFLENSIHHGFYPGIEKLHISIDVSYGEDTVIIQIKDNGYGISDEVLEQLRYSIDNKIINYSKHFGISNVNARISSHLYGNGTVSIESETGIGTTVTIEFDQMGEFEDEF